MCVCDRERTLAAASGDQLPAGCRGRLMKGLLASVTGVEISAAPPPHFQRGIWGWGVGSLSLLPGPAGLHFALLPSPLGPRPRTCRLGWPWVTRLQSPCSGVDGPSAGSPPL